MTQMDLIPYFEESDRRTMYRKDGHDTSQGAAESFEGERLTKIQEDVLEWFRSAKKGTDEDVENALMHKHPAASTLRKRRTDLVRKGFLRDSGERQRNHNNRNMIVWELV